MSVKSEGRVSDPAARALIADALRQARESIEFVLKTKDRIDLDFESERKDSSTLGPAYRIRMEGRPDDLCEDLPPCVDLRVQLRVLNGIKLLLLGQGEEDDKVALRE